MSEVLIDQLPRLLWISNIEVTMIEYLWIASSMDFEKKKYKKMLKTIIKTLSNFFNTSYTVELIQKPKPAQSSSLSD